MIGKIERLPLREVWKHEALDFTTWLQDNIDILNDALEISLSSAEREQAAGDFSVDLLAQDEGGDLVVVENQLERSDHDHLGKVLTYLTTFEAKAAVWIVSEPRPEHVRVVAWLNEVTPASFYLVKVEAVRIGESSPAPLLTLIVGPSEESKVLGQTKKDLADRQRAFRRFWTQLLDKLRDKRTRHSNLSPRHDSWLSAGAGRSGMSFDYCVRKRDSSVYLWISRGREGLDETKAIYEALSSSREEIESKFGGALVWTPPEGRASAMVSHEMTLGGWENEDGWPELQDAMIDAMIRLEKALRPHIDALEV